ncbi:MAG: hypothetical protein AB7K24_31200, partial [Gemmataceae bacterium]
MRTTLSSILVVLACFVATANLPGQKKQNPTEEDYYHLITFPLPEDVVLEVGGLDWLDEKKERLMVCTRRGELWVCDNVYVDPPQLPGQAT